MPTDWTDGEDRRMAEYRGEGPHAERPSLDCEGCHRYDNTVRPRRGYIGHIGDFCPDCWLDVQEGITGRRQEP